MRTMQQLQNDMDANRRDNLARMCELAIAAGNASDAASFAIGAVRVARYLATPETAIAELQTEPILRLVQNDDATVRWNNSDYAEAMIAAGGVLVIRRAA